MVGQYNAVVVLFCVFYKLRLVCREKLPSLKSSLPIGLRLFKRHDERGVLCALRADVKASLLQGGGVKRGSIRRPAGTIASAVLICQWFLWISVVFLCDFGIGVFVMNWISIWCIVCAMLPLELRTL